MEGASRGVHGMTLHCDQALCISPPEHVRSRDSSPASSYGAFHGLAKASDSTRKSRFHLDDASRSRLIAWPRRQSSEQFRAGSLACVGQISTSSGSSMRASSPSEAYAQEKITQVERLAHVRVQELTNAMVYDREISFESLLRTKKRAKRLANILHSKLLAIGDLHLDVLVRRIWSSWRNVICARRRDAHEDGGLSGSRLAARSVLLQDRSRLNTICKGTTKLLNISFDKVILQRALLLWKMLLVRAHLSRELCLAHVEADLQHDWGLQLCSYFFSKHLAASDVVFRKRLVFASWGWHAMQSAVAKLRLAELHRAAVFHQRQIMLTAHLEKCVPSPHLFAAAVFRLWWSSVISHRLFENAWILQEQGVVLTARSERRLRLYITFVHWRICLGNTVCKLVRRTQKKAACALWSLHFEELVSVVLNKWNLIVVIESGRRQELDMAWMFFVKTLMNLDEVLAIREYSARRLLQRALARNANQRASRHSAVAAFNFGAVRLLIRLVWNTWWSLLSRRLDVHDALKQSSRERALMDEALRTWKDVYAATQWQHELNDIASLRKQLGTYIAHSDERIQTTTIIAVKALCVVRKWHCDLLVADLFQAWHRRQVARQGARQTALSISFEYWAECLSDIVAVWHALTSQKRNSRKITSKLRRLVDVFEAMYDQRWVLVVFHAWKLTRKFELGVMSSSLTAAPLVDPLPVAPLKALRANFPHLTCLPLTKSESSTQSREDSNAHSVDLDWKIVARFRSRKGGWIWEEIGA